MELMLSITVKDNIDLNYCSLLILSESIFLWNLTKYGFILLWWNCLAEMNWQPNNLRLKGKKITDLVIALHISIIEQNLHSTYKLCKIGSSKRKFNKSSSNNMSLSVSYLIPVATHIVANTFHVKIMKLPC